jgi:hypothetical protein
MIDWDQVARQALAAAANVIGTQWPIVEAATSQQMAAWVQLAKDVEAAAHNHQITRNDYEFQKLGQQRALEILLSSYETISLIIAQQAALAAWAVVEAALKAIPALAWL